MSDDAANERRLNHRHNQSHGNQAERREPAPLLASKLYRPRPRPALVARGRLLARLEAGLRGTITLIAAPAGFGKTTLLADWLSQTAATDRHAAWVSLDAGDSDPGQFLRYVLAALQAIAPSIGATVLPLLQSARLPPLETLLPVVANDLAQLPDGSLLVLDDYHVVDAPAVHQALSFLIEHLPPQLHLVIVSRTDPPLPLARWRARAQLTELRAQDLRFTTQEAQAFFDEVMDVSLTAADVAAVEARTEGWIAGLQLAALSLQNRPAAQLSAFIEGFTGSHRFVVDYLLDEVLTRQPAAVQRFMLKTAILQRLSGPLCGAVVGLDSASSQQLLEHLERANLFVVPLDEERRWYRYHHLFAQVLHERIASDVSPEGVATLHTRAATWFEQHEFVVDAVRHALAAQDWARAERLIQSSGRLLIVRGQVHTVRGWLDQLPETVVRANPFLLDFQAVTFYIANQVDAAERCIEAAEAAVTDLQPDENVRAILGYTAVLRANIARSRGALAPYVRLSQRALEHLPAAEVLLRSTAILGNASSFLVSGNVGSINEHDLDIAVATARASGNLLTLFNSLITVAEFQRRQGRLHAAAASYRAAAHSAPEPIGLQGVVNGAAYYFGLGDILREWNDPAAEMTLLRGKEMMRRLQVHGDAVARGYVALARLQQGRGERRAALSTLHELEQLAHEYHFASELRERGATAAAHLALMQGELAAAVRWADTLDALLAGEQSYLREQEYLTVARVRIAEGRGALDGPALNTALRLLDRLLDDAEAASRMDSVIEIMMLRALVFDAQGEHDRALESLQQALRCAAPEGYVRIFVDEGMPMATLLSNALRERRWGRQQSGSVPEVRAYAEHLLAMLRSEGVALSDNTQSAGPLLHTTPSGEVLTERELEVLRLLAAGRSNAAMADELVVAVGTVKRHVSNIMGKLQAESRLEAVARARALGLV